MPKWIRIALPILLLVSLAAFTDSCDDNDSPTNPLSSDLTASVSLSVTPTAAAGDGICRLSADVRVSGGDIAAPVMCTWDADSLKLQASSWSDAGCSLSASFQDGLAAGGHPFAVEVSRGRDTVLVSDIVQVDCGADDVYSRVF